MEANNNLNNYSKNTNTPTPYGDYLTPNTFDNDKTFNRLRDLQSLIKKESALKELCKYNYFIKFITIFF